MEHSLSFFYFFASLALFSALLVILNKNPIYSALFLMLVFLNVAFIVLLLDLELLALFFILIYIGAIMVLVLFIIMMLDIKFSWIYLNTYYYFFLSGVFLFIFVSEFLYFLSFDFLGYLPYSSLFYINWYSLIWEKSTMQTLGLYLYTTCSFFFLISGLILLVAMIGAISLTLDPLSKSFSKTQSLHNQLSAKPANAMFYVKNDF